MKKTLLILLLAIPFIGFGQGWETHLGVSLDAVGRSVLETADGGYIIAGDISANNGKVYLIKTDGNGIEQWFKTIGGTYLNRGFSLQETTDGGYIIAGLTYPSFNEEPDVYLIKTDDIGNTLWTKTYGGIDYDEGYSVQQTTDGGYIIAGNTESFGSGNRDVYLIKVNSQGDIIWTNTFGGSQYDIGHSVQQTLDGGYIIGAYTESFGNGDYDCYLIKTDANGVEQWNKTFGGGNYDLCLSVEQTTDGGYILAGNTESFGSGDFDVWLIKTDANGDSLWTKTFGGTGDDRGFSVKQTTDGGYIVLGNTESYGSGDKDVYLIKTDGSGAEQWSQTFGGSYDDRGLSIQQTSDGGYIVTGFTDTFGSKDLYLIKTDGNGNATSIFNIPISNPNRKLDMVVDMLGR